jgi:hypothetical protein
MTRERHGWLQEAASSITVQQLSNDQSQPRGLSSVRDEIRSSGMGCKLVMCRKFGVEGRNQVCKDTDPGGGAS